MSSCSRTLADPILGRFNSSSFFFFTFCFESNFCVDLFASANEQIFPNFDSKMSKFQLPFDRQQHHFMVSEPNRSFYHFSSSLISMQTMLNWGVRWRCVDVALHFWDRGIWEIRSVFEHRFAIDGAWVHNRLVKYFLQEIRLRFLCFNPHGGGMGGSLVIDDSKMIFLPIQRIDSKFQNDCKNETSDIVRRQLQHASTFILEPNFQARTVVA